MNTYRRQNTKMQTRSTSHSWSTILDDYKELFTITTHLAKQ